ncbi:hypothetical protein DFH27DRAFT_203763 [Peziza echinospora]|nr:hypothetical protein DFH27DRAFT_203763 [Peziza echinospora]
MARLGGGGVVLLHALYCTCRLQLFILSLQFSVLSGGVVPFFFYLFYIFSHIYIYLNIIIR